MSTTFAILTTTRRSSESAASHRISQDPEFIRRTFGTIARRYDAANHLLSGGLDFLWRRRVARIASAWKPTRILDVATGSGDLAITLGRALPDARIIGSDFCPPMLQQARAKGLTALVAADALRLPFRDASFDLVTVAFGLRNMEDYGAALAEMRRVLREKGHLLILDFSLPTPLLRGVYRFYLHRVLPHIARVITGDGDAYRYLGGSIELFPSGPVMTQLIEQCGFRDARFERLTAGVVSIYSAEAK